LLIHSIKFKSINWESCDFELEILYFIWFFIYKNWRRCVIYLLLCDFLFIVFLLFVFSKRDVVYTSRWFLDWIIYLNLLEFLSFFILLLHFAFYWINFSFRLLFSIFGSETEENEEHFYSLSDIEFYLLRELWFLTKLNLKGCTFLSRK